LFELILDSFRLDKTQSGFHVALVDLCDDCAEAFAPREFSNGSMPIGQLAYWLDYKKGVPRAGFGFVQVSPSGKLVTYSVIKIGGGLKDHMNTSPKYIDSERDLEHAWHDHFDRNIMQSMLNNAGTVPVGCSGWWYVKKTS